MLGLAPSSGCATFDGWFLASSPVPGFSPVEGCLIDSSSPDVHRAICPGNITWGTASRGPEPWMSVPRVEAFALAHPRGARVVCDELVLSGQAGPRRVERCRNIALDTGLVTGVALGAAFAVANPQQANATQGSGIIFCTAVSPGDEAVCTSLLASAFSALPSAPTSAPPEHPTAAASAGPRAQATNTSGVGGSGTLPAECSLSPTGRADLATCDGGVVLRWKQFTDAADANSVMASMLREFGVTGAPRAAYTCSLNGQRGRCTEYDNAIGGLAWISGKTVGLLCVGQGVTRAHPICGSVLPPAPRQEPGEGAPRLQQR